MIVTKMAVEKQTILIVEDDAQLLELMTEVVTNEGYDAVGALKGELDLQLFEERKPALVLLDVLLPGLNGYEVCKQIRKFSQVPIIMTTCKSSPEDKLEGFAAGASDYLCKPWIIRELVARVRVWTNNTLIQTEKIQLFELSGLVININSETVIVNGLKINLTPSEYKTLALLARNYGRVISSHEIQKEILNCEPQSDDTELCRVIISRLRNKLGDDPRSPKYIETQTGKGYVFGPKEYLTKPH